MRNLIQGIRSWDAHSSMTEAERLAFRVSNITQAVLFEADFEGCLRVFAQDGHRYRRNHPDGNYPPDDESTLTEIVATLTRKFHSVSSARYALLLSLVTAGSPPIRHYYPNYTTGLNPISTQVLSVHGYDFFKEVEGEESYLVHLNSNLASGYGIYSYQELLRSNLIILDRHLVQHGIHIPASLVLDLGRFVRHLPVQLWEHLQDREQSYPGLIKYTQSVWQRDPIIRSYLAYLPK